jgi:ethanolamine ammonia-lyase small subunit
MTRPTVTDSPWRDWRAFTPARVALGRAGNGLPTDEVLRFGLAHALARDAIQAALDVETLEANLRRQRWDVLRVKSRAKDRVTYLRRPDLGRVLDPRDGAAVSATRPPPCDLCFVIGDGLSALAVSRHAVPLLAALRPLLHPGLRAAPVIIAEQARVALADEIGELLRARLAIILIGERPGLSSPDSLGVYMTHAPFRHRTDADRNCISNVRPEGLSYAAAARKLAWHISEALRRGLTGVDLKDVSDAAPAMLRDAAATAALPTGKN